MRIQSGAMEEIDNKFSLSKDNEFELRLFIFPNGLTTMEDFQYSYFHLKMADGKPDCLIMPRQQKILKKFH